MRRFYRESSEFETASGNMFHFVWQYRRTKFFRQTDAKISEKDAKRMQSLCGSHTEYLGFIPNSTRTLN